MDYKLKNFFNPELPKVMHIDINSCFASIEQQYNPKYRNKPIVVAPNYGQHGTIVAASKEAKKLGIKTGHKVYEAQKIYPQIIVVGTHIERYKEVHKKLKTIIEKYCPIVIAKSIDEFTADFRTMHEQYDKDKMIAIAKLIKQDIKNEIGIYITVSIGIAPNAFLAKTASDIKKPDGLEIIDSNNYQAVYEQLTLTDLCGINTRNEIRLNNLNIFSVIDFYSIDYQKLHSGLKSITAYFWYMKLRGWEVDDINTHRGSFSHSYVLRENITSLYKLKPILSKLIVQLTDRIRNANYSTRGLVIQINYQNGQKILKKYHGAAEFFDTVEIYNVFIKMLKADYIENIKVKQVYVAFFDLRPYQNLQLNLLTDQNKKAALYKAIDDINKKWGRDTVIPSITHTAKSAAPDAISFGKPT